MPASFNFAASISESHSSGSKSSSSSGISIHSFIPRISSKNTNSFFMEFKTNPGAARSGLKFFNSLAGMIFFIVFWTLPLLVDIRYFLLLRLSLIFHQFLHLYFYLRHNSPTPELYLRDRNFP